MSNVTTDNVILMKSTPISRQARNAQMGKPPSTHSHWAVLTGRAAQNTDRKINRREENRREGKQTRRKTKGQDNRWAENRWQKTDGQEKTDKKTGKKGRAAKQTGIKTDGRTCHRGCENSHVTHGTAGSGPNKLL